MSNIETLKELSVTIGRAKSVDKVTGTTIAEVLAFMAKNYSKSS